VRIVKRTITKLLSRFWSSPITKSRTSSRRWARLGPSNGQHSDSKSPIQIAKSSKFSQTLINTFRDSRTLKKRSFHNSIVWLNRLSTNRSSFRPRQLTSWQDWSCLMKESLSQCQQVLLLAVDEDSPDSILWSNYSCSISRPLWNIYFNTTISIARSTSFDNNLRIAETHSNVLMSRSFSLVFEKTMYWKFEGRVERMIGNIWHTFVYHIKYVHCLTDNQNCLVLWPWHLDSSISCTHYSNGIDRFMMTGT
jgi:hypothetical protein